MRPMRFTVKVMDAAAVAGVIAVVMVVWRW